jgi:hypothetical protein
VAETPANRRVGDTTFVTNRAPAFADTATLRIVMRIGRIDGPDEYAFRHVEALAVSAAGHVYVADLGGPVREYDTAGVYVRTVARYGRGPGEVTGVGGMVATQDGRLLIRDDGNRRVSAFGADGALVTEWPLPAGRTAHGHEAIVHAGTAAWIGINPSLPPDGSPLRFPRPAYVRLNPDGVVADTISIPARFTHGCPVLSSRDFRSGWFEDLRFQYVPKVKWALDGAGRLLVGCPATYEFEIVSPDGAVRRVSRPWEPLVASDEERAVFKAGQTVAMNESGTFERWSWTGPDLPAQRPAYQRLIPAADGRVWVWPSQPTAPIDLPPERPPGAPRVWYLERRTGAFDVFDPDGRWVGAVRLPPQFAYVPWPETPDPYIRGDTVWGVTMDSLEVEYPTRFEVVWRR